MSDIEAKAVELEDADIFLRAKVLLAAPELTGPEPTGAVPRGPGASGSVVIR
ncbi:hypothetical protein ACQEVX_12185 [Streptomyces syringium]|uniref:hypothetical protein n=1 Tax=Streptomyces syringium TaxID=76729 RepID=UPI003D926A01